MGLLKIVKEIDNYLTDNECKPKPIEELTLEPFIYIKQLIVLAAYWTPDARLAVGSIVVGQPLKAQGATDIHFVFSDDPDEEYDKWDGPRGYYQISDKGYICLEIAGDWSADVNGPANHALTRMGARLLKLEDQWTHLYNFVRAVASDGFGVSLNQIQKDEGISPLALAALMDAERKLVKRAVDALNTFEGRDEEQSNLMRGLPNNDEVRDAAHLGVRGDE